MDLGSNLDLGERSPSTVGRGAWRMPQWLVDRSSMVVEWLLAMAISIPMLLVTLLSVIILLARIVDTLGNLHSTDYLRGALFGHIADTCDQPIGVMLICFWCIVFFRVTLLYAWINCFEGGCLTTACCENQTCRSLKVFLYSSIIVLTVIFELSWPVTTFSMLVLAKDCSWQLKVNAWLLLCPYLLQLLGLALWLLWLQCLQRFCRRSGLIRDPSQTVESFETVPYDSELFFAKGYPSTCSICLSDFSADGGEPIVLAPCEQSHVFHRSCLAGWFGRSQTCPLCRRELHQSAEREVELTVLS